MYKMKISTIFILLALITVALGQSDEEEQKSKFDLNLDFEKEAKTGQFLTPQPGWLGQIFEKEINPDDYILGPGDQLIIKMLGATEQQYVTVVTPEGYIIIPSITRTCLTCSNALKSSCLAN